MSGTGTHTRKKKSWKDIGPVIGYLADGGAVLTQLLSWCVPFLQNGPLLILIEFVFVITILWCIVCMLDNRAKEKRNDKLISQKEMQGLDNDKKIIRYEKYEEAKKKYNERKNILAGVIIISLLFAGLDARSLYKLIPYNKGTEEADLQGTAGESGEVRTVRQAEEVISYDMVSDISFCLNEAVIPSLEAQDAARIFYVLYEEEADAVGSHTDLARNKTSGEWKLTEKEKEMILSASLSEIDFKERVEEAKACKEKRQMTEWQDIVPDVSDYKKDVIEERVIIIDGEKADGEICLLVANDYQFIGDEYKNQNKEYEAIVYYWGQSIIYTEEGLMYGDLSEETWDKYYSYLKARYKDIADYIDQVWDQIEEGDKETYGMWRDAAQKIYEEM